MTEYSNCPNCDEKLKSGAFGSNQLLSPDKVRAINLIFDEQLEFACARCAGQKSDFARFKLHERVQSLKQLIEKKASIIPVLSLQSPVDWNYRAICLVTAQSTTGTGIFSDITSSVTDVFGMQSGSYNKKIRAGEELCTTSLQTQALACGGNAVLAVDIDYAEVGGQRAMLMVCMTGTAVRLENLQVVGERFREEFSDVDNLYREYLEIKSLADSVVN